MRSSVKILRASAGSGKTYRLAYEYISRVVAQPLAYRHILAVTFTNKATEEMKSRILAKLDDLSNISVSGANQKVDYLDELVNDCGIELWKVKENARLAKSFILHDYDNFAVSTIDKFFQRIARSFFKELDLEFDYQVELSEDGYVAEAVDRLIESAKSDELLRELIGFAVSEQLDKNSWDIKKRLGKLAKVITNEGYRRLSLPAKDLIGMLYKAKEELEMYKNYVVEKANIACEAVEGAGLSGMDFFQSKNSFVSQLEKMRSGRMVEYNSYYIKALDGVEGWYSKTSSNKDIIISLEGVLQPLIEQVRADIDKYHYLNNGISAVEKNFSVFLLLDYLAEQMDRLWGENNMVPISRTTDLIADITAKSSTPFIYEKLGAHYSTYMIDEFQDTSKKQWEGFKPLIEEVLSSSQVESVMLIGDVKQAIYRWRGGDWNILASQVESDFAGRVDDSESLTTNWRSYNNVINFNNNLFEQLIKVESQVLPQCEEREMVGNAYKEYVQEESGSKKGGYVEVKVSEDADADLLDRIVHLVEKQNFAQKDIAILTRTRNESSRIAHLLVNGGFSVLSDEALLLDNSPVVRFVISMLKLSVDSSDVVSILLVNRFLGIGGSDVLRNREVAVLERISINDPIRAFEEVIIEYNLESREVAYVQALFEYVYRFCVGVSGDTGQFVKWWEENKYKLSIAVPKGQDAITIITIHKAKGLQYPVVMLPYANWSMIPNRDSKMWANANCENLSDMGMLLIDYVKTLENSPFQNGFYKELIYSHIDNLNLLYVALTRAVKELYIFIDIEPEKNSVADLLSFVLPKVGGLEYNSSKKLYSFGKRSNKDIQSDSIGDDKSLNINDLKISRAKSQIAVKLPNFKLEDDNITNRQMGVIMHALFSKVNFEEDFEQQISIMELSGSMSTDLATTLRSSVESWMSQNTVRQWFDKKWKIFSERTILTQLNSNYRPDRVLVDGNKAVVIDFKFGEKKSKKYNEQVEMYCDLLETMGYCTIKGYLWYISGNEVVEVR